jgi:hypothetical protein
MKIVLRKLILPAVLFLTGQQALAHGGGEKPLFVSPDGVDTGECIDSLNPCQSLAYALGVAGKGSVIRVATGTYPIEDPEDLFHVVSGVVQVTGGYERAENYARAGAGVSVLTGVPVEFRELLRSRGFHVIADRKGIDESETAKTLQLLELHEKQKSSLPATPCNGGFAGGLACNSVICWRTWHSGHQCPTYGSNDIWGFVDLNTNREYIMIGYNIGTACRRHQPGCRAKSDSSTGRIPAGHRGPADVRRDGRALAAYAYVTTDASTDGLYSSIWRSSSFDQSLSTSATL